jgi:hypothetical protein
MTARPMTRFLLFLLVLFPALFASAQTIALAPANPRPGDRVDFTVSGVVLCGHVSLLGVNTTGKTIAIETRCDAIIVSAPGSFTLSGSFTAPQTPGIYQVELWYTSGDQRGLVSTRQLSVADGCNFGQSLVVDRNSVRVGDTVNLSWCDPAFSSVDSGYYVNSYTIYSAPSPAGPFTKVMDVQGGSSTQAAVTMSTAGNTNFYVVAHGCQGALIFCASGSLGDTVVNSNVIAVGVGKSPGCTPSAATLCLLNGRFEVTAQFRTAGSGVATSAHAVALTDQSGYFWFFGPDNIEVTLKALNACPASYWVFASGMTNVGVDITVRDTQALKTRTYSNAVNTPFATILDTNAFSCP